MTRARPSRWFIYLAGVIYAAGYLTLPCHAGPELVSIQAVTQPPPAAGNGYSSVPLANDDGRFVLFASTANNLTTNDHGSSFAGIFPPRFNAFCRDRLNQLTFLLSVNLTGQRGGNGDSFPAGISADGRFALFESRAADLIAGDTNDASDLFVRDLLSNRTILVSAATNGMFGNGPSRSAVLTPDGRFVAFVSAANNLVPDDTNGIADVFIRDLQSNVTAKVSAGATRFPTGPAPTSESPLVTPDGRYVAFLSSAANLAPGAGNSPNVYLRDLVTGTTTWVSSDASNIANSVFQAANAVCFGHALSTDGQWVAYELSSGPYLLSSNPAVVVRYHVPTDTTEIVHTNATVSASSVENIRNLDMTSDGRFIAFIANTNDPGNSCVLVWDGQANSLALASSNTNGVVPPGSVCKWPSLDPTGRFVAFLSSATGLTTNPLNGEFHVYRRDTQIGTTFLVDADTNGIGSSVSPAAIPRLSANGQLIAFEAFDGNLVPNDRNREYDVFVRDANAAGAELISSRHPALASLSANGPSTLWPGSANQDGQLVAFASDADNLVPNDTNQLRDVFVHDLARGTNLLVSTATNGGTADGWSTEPSISADGRFVAFTSWADNLVPNDTNKTADVFLRDLLNGTTYLVSVGTNGVSPGNQMSSSPILSADGRYVYFRSKASNLAGGTVPGMDNLFMWDRQLQTIRALTLNSVTTFASSVDGRFMLFLGALGGLGSSSRMYLWDAHLANWVYTNLTVIPARLGVSPDGNRLVYISSSQLHVIDRAANTNSLIGTSSSGSRFGLNFSADGRFLVYSGSLVGGINYQIYVYDFQTGSNSLISQDFATAALANGTSESPVISSDGRFIAYTSTATNLVPGDTNGWPDIFLYDRSSGTNLLVSTTFPSGEGARAFSLLPIFSRDAIRVLFQSWAPELLPGDFNGASDLESYPLYASLPQPQLYTSISIDPNASVLWISWPTVAGKNYKIEFKTALADDQWQELSGGIQLLGSKGYCKESIGPARWYRIVAY